MIAASVVRGPPAMRLKSPADFKRLRLEAGHTQQSLADAVGRSRATIGHLETGALTDVKPVTARLLEWALSMPTGSLFAMPEDAPNGADRRVRRTRPRRPTAPRDGPSQPR